VHKRLLAERERSPNAIVTPVFEGKRGHPVVFPAALFSELREVREATKGMRAVMERHANEILEVEFDSPVVILDMNRPEEYEAARATYFSDIKKSSIRSP
jgi:molybdenum cofactor cytidylyltransferase